MQVVLLGATRSGTSVTTGVLHRLGVTMGSDLVPRDERNPIGFYEDREFLNLNERIMAAAGGDFIRPPGHERILAQQPLFQAEISGLVRRRDASYGTWGWKTTTTCLTLELFLPELRDPRLILLFRNPLAVARSQLRFTPGELEMVEALQLPLAYCARVLDSIERHPEIPFAFVSYEELAGNPRKVAADIAAFLGLAASPQQIRWAASLVASRRRLGRERARLTVRRWRSSQVRRARRAQRMLREEGADALAGHVMQRLRGDRDR